MIRREPGDPQLRRRLAAIHGNLATVYLMKLNDKSKARESYLKAMGLQEEVVRQDPTQVYFKNDLATTYNNVAFVVDDRREALAWGERALEARRQLSEKEPTNTLFRHNVARTQGMIGEIQAKLGRSEEGLKSLEESCRLLQQVVAEQPTVTMYQSNLAQMLGNLGSALVKADRNGEARAPFEQTRAICQKIVHANPEDAYSREMLRSVEQELAAVQKQLSKNSRQMPPPSTTTVKDADGKIGPRLP